MSKWQDALARVKFPDGRRLVGGSFRGVPFGVDSTERSGGRRTVVHEFPQRDDPYVEDLGRKARSFRFDGYVVGDDYLTQKNALLAALEDKSGPGELIHPYYGRKVGICTSLQVRETVADGRMAIFSIEFAETPKQIASPVTSPDPAGDVSSAADTASTATNTAFQSKYNVQGQPSWAVQSLANELTNRTKQLRKTLGAVTATTQEIAALDRATKNLVNTVQTLVRTPGDILGAFVGVMFSFEQTLTSAPRKVMQALKSSYDFPLEPLPVAGTATRAKETTNLQALGSALRTTLAIQSANLIATVAYETLEDAQTDAAAVTGMLDDQILIATDDAYPALIELRAATVRAVPGDAILARQLTVVRRAAVPSILLSYQLYGNEDQELNIVTRNGSQHPGFLFGSLKVLSADV